MLSITNKELEDYGCPNCGCDSIQGGGGRTTGKCRHCSLRFEIRHYTLGKTAPSCVQYGVHRITPSDPKSDLVMEHAIAIDHPRAGIPAWHWEPEDCPPEEGEYWDSRGPGYPDVSGFVPCKQAGERILKLVQHILGKEDCKSFLDFRPSEPLWIQFKFHKDEFDIEKLDSMSRENNHIITKHIIESCVWL